MTLTLNQLKRASLLFVVTPNILFLYFWVISPINIICCLLLVMGSILYFRTNTTSNTPKSIDSQSLIIIAFLAFLFAIISGVGGFADQIFDYLGHNTKFRDLLINDWPFKYKSINQYPCYYFGYYLVPAYLAKHIGHINSLSIIWVFVGIYLVMLWVYILIGNKKYWSILIFFLWGGFYAVLYNLYGVIAKWFPIEHLYWSDFVPMSKGFLVYMPLYLSLIWVPNQFLPSCIAISVIVYEIYFEKKNYGASIFIPLLAIWAPFAGLGVGVLFAGMFIIQNIKKELTFSIKTDAISLLLIILGVSPIILYLLSTNSGESVKGFLWNFEPNWLLYWIFFIVIEFGFITYLAIRIKQDSIYTKYLSIILLYLLLLPLLRFGFNNDLMVRGNIPAYYLLNIFLTYQFFESLKSRSNTKWVLYILLIVGSLMPLKVMLRGLTHNKLALAPQTYFMNEDMYQILLHHHTPLEAKQYLAREDSFFIKHLQKK